MAASPRAGGETVRWIDERLGASGFVKKALRYVFPDHWSFMLGEIALYAFVFLVLSGTFLAFFYTPSDSRAAYAGSFEPLRGAQSSEAFRSVMNLSTDVPGGLLMRQAHHWAALIFIAAVAVHLARVLFTGAFRKPRDITYWIGVTLLAVVIVEGFTGYTLPDDLLSGMGLAIAYSVAMSIPIIGGKVAFLIWGGEYPGGHEFFSRLLIAHVFIFPALIALLIAGHLALVVRHHHAQFRGPGRREDNVVGTPMWPGYALRSLGLMVACFSMFLLLGGFVQINPIYHWGPYANYQASNGAQPDWFLGWLLGGLRLMPPLEIRIFGHTLVPNPFWGGLFFPTVVFVVLYAWPFLHRRLSRDHAHHHLLERPRDDPRNTGAAAAFLSWVWIVFVAGAMDRIYLSFGFSYESQVWFFRIVSVVAPIAVYFAARRWALRLRVSESHPFRGWNGHLVRRTPSGGYEDAREAPEVVQND
jgi:ubiquinol-cytochrome c reductase cytochrome b subunit